MLVQKSIFKIKNIGHNSKTIYQQKGDKRKEKRVHNNIKMKKNIKMAEYKDLFPVDGGKNFLKFIYKNIYIFKINVIIFEFYRN